VVKKKKNDFFKNNLLARSFVYFKLGSFALHSVTAVNVFNFKHSVRFFDLFNCGHYSFMNINKGKINAKFTR